MRCRRLADVSSSGTSFVEFKTHSAVPAVYVVLFLLAVKSPLLSYDHQPQQEVVEKGKKGGEVPRSKLCGRVFLKGAICF